MQKLALFVLDLFLVSFILGISCRKLDSFTSESLVEKRFFDVPADASPAAKAIAASIKKQNDENIL